MKIGENRTQQVTNCLEIKVYGYIPVVVRPRECGRSVSYAFKVVVKMESLHHELEQGDVRVLAVINYANVNRGRLELKVGETDICALQKKTERIKAL